MTQSPERSLILISGGAAILRSLLLDESAMFVRKSRDEGVVGCC